MHAWAQCIACFFVEKGWLPEELKPWCVYAAERRCVQAASMALLFVWGLVWAPMWQVLLYTASFVLLRRWAGGWHARTWGRCLVLSASVEAAGLVVLSVLQRSGAASVGLALAAGAVLWRCAPALPAQMHAGPAERRACRGRLRVTMGVQALLLGACLMCGQAPAAACIAVGCGTAAALAAAEGIKQRREE